MTAAKTIWVTGASSGLGRELARQLASSGHTVIASARNQAALDDLASESANIIPLVCDITSEESVSDARQRLDQQFAKLDQVILNAGNCEYLDFPEPDWQAVERVMNVNYFGTVNSLKAALPLLRKSAVDRPHIVCIASLVSSAPFPRAEAYGASKAALQYFFQSLRLDLAAENIDVSIINPGFVDTPLTRKNDFPMPFLMNVDDAAARIIQSFQKRPLQYGFPMRLRGLLFISKIFPRAWARLVTRQDKAL